MRTGDYKRVALHADSLSKTGEMTTLPAHPETRLARPHLDAYEDSVTSELQKSAKFDTRADAVGTAYSCTTPTPSPHYESSTRFI